MVTASARKRVTSTPVAGSTWMTSGETPALAVASRRDRLDPAVDIFLGALARQAEAERARRPSPTR